MTPPFPAGSILEGSQGVARPRIFVQQVVEHAGQVRRADRIRQGDGLVEAACAGAEAVDDPTLAFADDLDPEATVDIETATFAGQGVHDVKLARQLLPAKQLGCSEVGR